MISLKNTLEAIKSKISSHETSIDTLEDRQVYSTTEKVVGTWIDRKPIYRKVIQWTGSAANITLATMTNISDLVRVDMNGYTNYGEWLPIPAAHPTIIGCNSGWFLAGNLLRVEGSNRTFIKVNTIIEYTKTTD